MDELLLYDIDNKKLSFRKVSYDIRKNRAKFPYLEDSTMFINNKSCPTLTTDKWSSYVFYQNEWFVCNFYLFTLKLWTAPNAGRRLTVLNKFFDEGELL
jgi:hypothetical protein